MTAGKLINGVLFNITWLAVVYTHSAMWALVITAAHLALHFSLISSRFAEARLILGLTLFGAILDQLLFVLGVFALQGASAAAPVWMSCLWPVVGTTLLHAFRGLQQHILLATIFGALGGAASYTAGTRLTDVEFGSVFWGPIIMALLWAVLFPAMLAVARIMNTESGREHYVAS